MRISDWSSDVCSSDLGKLCGAAAMAAGGERQPFRSRPFGRGAVRQRAACRNTVVRGRRSVAEELAELGRGAVRPASGRKRIAGAVSLQELVQQLYRSDRDRRGGGRAYGLSRSEERRVGTVCVRKWRS